MKEFFDPFESMAFTYDKCFLCGRDHIGNESVEHVFPKWIQNRFNLWNQKLMLLNRTEIPYRQLTIPCCSTCNNQHLSKVEKQIQHAFEEGFEAICKIEEILIFQWVSKIFYGLFFKELSLPLERQDQRKVSITDPKFLERFKTLHGFLQSVRTPFKFEGFKPWSIFILETISYGDKRDFDYHDSFISLTFSIRMGNVGIIVCMEDNGIQKDMFGEYFARFNGIKLHPIQFDELVAKVVYKSILMNRTPKYMMILPEKVGEETLVISPSLQGFSGKPIFDEWDQETYAYFLAQYWYNWGVKFEDIFVKPNLVLSLLHNEEDSVKTLNPDGIQVE